MIEYDGYIDRSRIPTWLTSESSLYSKRAFLNLSRSLIYNKNRDTSTLLAGFEFKHEYKKLEYFDSYNSPLYGEVEEGATVSDQSKYILQKSSIYLKSNLNKFGVFNIKFSNLAISRIDHSSLLKKIK